MIDLPITLRSKSCQIILGALLAMLLIFLWSRFVYYTEARTAYDGYSPIGIVYKNFIPANFAKDFPSGSENYKKSAFTYVYFAAYQYFNIKPEAMIPAVMAFEIGLMALTMAFLTRTLFPQSHSFIAYLVILLFIASYAKELDLGRVGVYLEGKVNNVGDMLRMLAIAFTLRGQMLLAGIMLGLSFITNPLMSLIGGSFILAGVVVEPKRIVKSETLLGAGLFIAISAFWIYLMYDAANFSGGSIPADIWFAMSRMNSYHWFPVEFGLFTTRHDERFIPLLSFTILFLYCLPRPLRDLDRKILAGTLVMIVLITIGAVVPTLDISQMLVKLNLVRADEVLITIGLIYIVNRLLDIMATDSIVRMAVAAAILVSPFLFKPGFPLLLTMLLIVPSIFQSNIHQWTIGERCASAAAVLATGIMGYYALAGMTGSFWTPAYTGGTITLGLVFVFAVIGTIRKLAMPKKGSAVTIVMLLLVATLASGYWVIRQKPADAYLKLSDCYKQVQVWARESTPSDSLFMVDPAICYGWREFSQRSSFGNLREWIFNWANTNDYDTYLEGMKRFGEFGVALKPYLHFSPPIDGYAALSDEVEKRYHHADDGWRMSLARRYGIDYFVMDKNKMDKPVVESAGSFQWVYENSDFVVLKPRAER